MSSLVCPICASPIPADARTCPTCGSPLTPATGAGGATANHAQALKPGTQLDGGNFSVGRVLGHGGFGITYLGADLRGSHPVALKEFFPAGSGRDGLTVTPPATLRGPDYQLALERFLDEGRILARFHHPGIVDVYGVFQENATAYMAMEYLRGQTLAGRLEAQGGPLPESELLGLARALADALDAIHREGFLHRDIKPENVILAEGGGTPRPVLIDFGATREFAANKTLRQSVVLTPGYAPLEQYAQQARRGPFTDIYALAATLYHLATGEQPPAATDRAMGVDLKPPRTLNPALSVTFERALLHGLAMAIDQRPQSARAFYHELAGLPPPPPEPAPPPQPPPRERAAPRSPQVGRSPAPAAPPVPTPPPPPQPGHLGRVREIARMLRGDGSVPRDDGVICPVCRSATMVDPGQETGGIPCPVCNAADLREQVPAAARGRCPSCRTGTPEPVDSALLVPGTLLHCPACRVGSVVQYARPGKVLLPDIWARCDTCGADFDYHLQGDAMTLADLPNGPGQLDPALLGRTLPRAEWSRLAGRSDLLYLCPNCAAEIDTFPDDGSGRTLEWIAVDGRADRVPAAYRGRRCTPLELDKAAAGLTPDDGTHACPNCRAQFDEVARGQLALLRAPNDPRGVAARFGGRAHEIAFWRAVAAGKRDPAQPGLICPVCTAELAPYRDGSYGLSAYDRGRDPYGVGARLGGARDKPGMRLALDDWRRVAAGQPPAEEAQRLRQEAQREIWLALLAGEVALVDATTYPGTLDAGESLLLALPAARYRRTFVSYNDIDAGTLWLTTRSLRYHGNRGDETIPLATIRDFGLDRWDRGKAKEQDVVTLRRSDGEKQIAFGFGTAAQVVEATIDGLPLRLRLDGKHFVELCEALRRRA